MVIDGSFANNSLSRLQSKNVLHRYVILNITYNMNHKINLRYFITIIHDSIVQLLQLIDITTI